MLMLLLFLSIFLHIVIYTYDLGFPGDSDGKESACNAGYPCQFPGSGRSPGEGYVNPLQYSCLENPMDRGAWQAQSMGLQKSLTQLSDYTFTIILIFKQVGRWLDRQIFRTLKKLFSFLPKLTKQQNETLQRLQSNFERIQVTCLKSLSGLEKEKMRVWFPDMQTSVIVTTQPSYC